MAAESKEELGYKIEKLEDHIETLKKAEYPNEGEIARLELEVRKFKNMKGDEGLHTAREVEMPTSVTMGMTDQELLEKNPEHVARQKDSVDPKVTKEVKEDKPTRAAPLKSEEPKKD